MVAGCYERSTRQFIFSGDLSQFYIFVFFIIVSFQMRSHRDFIILHTFPGKNTILRVHLCRIWWPNYFGDSTLLGGHRQRDQGKLNYSFLQESYCSQPTTPLGPSLRCEISRGCTKGHQGSLLPREDSSTSSEIRTGLWLYPRQSMGYMP